MSGTDRPAPTATTDWVMTTSSEIVMTPAASLLATRSSAALSSSDSATGREETAGTRPGGSGSCSALICLLASRTLIVMSDVLEEGDVAAVVRVREVERRGVRHQVGSAGATQDPDRAGRVDGDGVLPGARRHDGERLVADRDAVAGERTDVERGGEDHHLGVAGLDE